MDLIQSIAILITLFHFVLLISIFAATSVHTDAFVSTEIHASLWFRLALSLIVLCEAALCVAYVREQGGVNIWFCSAVALAAAAVGGWTLVVAFPVDKAAHVAGAVAFIAATACYSAIFIDRSLRFRTLLYAMWALSITAATAFAILYFCGIYADAAALEWTSFILEAATLLLFFASNPPEEIHTHTILFSSGEDREWRAPVLYPPFTP